MYAVKALGEADWADEDTGSLQATFSRFNVVDHDGDVTLRSAFTDGQAVPMVWAHDWSRPVGRGVVRVLKDRAVFDGTFFLDTATGREAHALVKAMGDLQEYSYGYAPLEAEPGLQDGQPVRLLRKLQVFEVSPVLVGAGVGTGTERIKQVDPDPEPEPDLPAIVPARNPALQAALEATLAQYRRTIARRGGT